MPEDPIFRPVSAERAEQLKKMLLESRQSSLNINPNTGEISSDSVDQAEKTQINAIGKFDTHYR